MSPEGDSEVTLSNLHIQADIAISESLEKLLQEERYSDLRTSLPETFAQDLMDFAWLHQSDPDSVVFRRSVEQYIRSIARGDSVEEIR